MNNRNIMLKQVKMQIAVFAPGHRVRFVEAADFIEHAAMNGTVGGEEFSVFELLDVSFVVCRFIGDRHNHFSCECYVAAVSLYIGIPVFRQKIGMWYAIVVRKDNHLSLSIKETIITSGSGARILFHGQDFHMIEPLVTWKVNKLAWTI